MKKVSVMICAYEGLNGLGKWVAIERPELVNLRATGSLALLETMLSGIEDGTRMIFTCEEMSEEEYRDLKEQYEEDWAPC